MRGGMSLYKLIFGSKECWCVKLGAKGRGGLEIHLFGQCKIGLLAFTNMKICYFIKPKVLCIYFFLIEQHIVLLLIKSPRLNSS
jgi:hypothetical protein